jgi:hypothetical protein
LSYEPVVRQLPANGGKSLLRIPLGPVFVQRPQGKARRASMPPAVCERGTTQHWWSKPLLGFTLIDCWSLLPVAIPRWNVAAIAGPFENHPQKALVHQ